MPIPRARTGSAATKPGLVSIEVSKCQQQYNIIHAAALIKSLKVPHLLWYPPN